MKLDDELYKNVSYPYFVVGFSIIIILNVISIIYYFFNLYVMIRVKHYKSNIQMIHQAVYATCPISSVFIIIEGIVFIMEKREEYPLPFVIQLFKSTLKSPPLFALVAIMLERLCATYFIRDYEGNQRPIIGYSIILLLLILSIIAAFTLNCTKKVILFVVGHFICYVIFYILSLITYQINRNYYNKNREHKHSYSLGERFQISENIRFYKFFSHYLFVLAFFPMVCTVSVFLKSIDSNPMHKDILTLIFHLSFTSLCFLAPYLTYKMSEPWQNELEIIYAKIGIKKSCKIHEVRETTKQLRGTFGEEINVETYKHTDVYFNQLNSSWNQKGSLRV